MDHHHPFYHHHHPFYNHHCLFTTTTLFLSPLSHFYASTHVLRHHHPFFTATTSFSPHHHPFYHHQHNIDASTHISHYCQPFFQHLHFNTIVHNRFFNLLVTMTCTVATVVYEYPYLKSLIYFFVNMSASPQKVLLNLGAPWCKPEPNLPEPEPWCAGSSATTDCTKPHCSGAGS